MTPEEQLRDAINEVSRLTKRPNRGPGVYRETVGSKTEIASAAIHLADLVLLHLEGKLKYHDPRPNDDWGPGPFP